MELTNLETADLCRQLALLMHSGVTVGDGLSLMVEGEENEPLRDLLKGMMESVYSGAYLSQAFEEAGCFSAYVTGLLQVGEQVGRTEETLNALADYYEEKERMERQLVSSLTYPAILFLLMAVVIIVLLSQVLPIFNEIYASLGGELTGVAGVLLGLGQAIDKAIPLLCVLLAAGTAAGLLFLVCGSLRKRAMAALTARWGDKGIFRKLNNARYVQALAMGYASGMPLEDAADLANVLLKGVPSVEARCGKCAQMLREGEELTKAIAAGELMPPATCQLLALGLRSGAGDTALERIAKRMQDGARDDLERMVSRVEPALVLVTSVLVGLILMSVMLPMMNIMTAIG